MVDQLNDALLKTNDLLKDSTVGLKETLDEVEFQEKMEQLKETLFKDSPLSNEFMKFIDQMNDLSDEEKEQLKMNLAGKAFGGDMFGNMAKKRMQAGFYEYSEFVIMVLIILFVFGFFGYKLYTSIMLKEQKRLAPKLTKEQKKELKKEGKKTPASPNGKAVSPKKSN